MDLSPFLRTKTGCRCLPAWLVRIFGVCAAWTAVAASPEETTTDTAVASPGVVCLGNAGGSSVLRLEADCRTATLPFLSWDTEGGDRAKNNLLRTGISLKGRSQGALVDLAVEGTSHGQDEVQFRLAALDRKIIWTVRTAADGSFTMQFAAESRSGKGTVPFSSDENRDSPPVVRTGGENAAANAGLDALELAFPFSPRMAATVPLPSRWETDGSLRLPAVISAPDFGQMLLNATPGNAVRGRLLGSRAQQTADFMLEMPVPSIGETRTLAFAPLYLPAPAGMQKPSLWRAARRGWFNAFQPTAEWGDQSNPFSAPAGVLANNVISDPVSCLVCMWADQALLTPKFSDDIRPTDLVRRTVEWWLKCRTRPTGEVVAYWDHGDMLDTNASVLIAAWSYAEATGDRAWLSQQMDRLEMVADYLVRRDIDDDGLIESTHSGNYGELKDPMRADSAYDTINGGHKNAYCNAMIYRGFRCLADVEKQLQRPERQAEYTRRADRLKAAYFKTFFDPDSGWLIWWQSRDGQRHNLSSPMINSLAICYGLVEPDRGREIMRRLWTKVEAVGFRRFDLGVPLTLTPVPRGDYLMGKGICAAPQKEDGSDTFGQYLNGGCLVSDAVYFITALSIVGETERADQVLKAMLERQEKGVFANGGGFQNGVIDKYPQGAEFYTWDGATCGYEGHLTYSFSFLQALLLREPAFRARLYRPLQE